MFTQAKRVIRNLLGISDSSIRVSEESRSVHVEEHDATDETVRTSEEEVVVEHHAEEAEVPPTFRETKETIDDDSIIDAEIRPSRPTPSEEAKESTSIYVPTSTERTSIVRKEQVMHFAASRAILWAGAVASVLLGLTVLLWLELNDYMWWEFKALLWGALTSLVVLFIATVVHEFASSNDDAEVKEEVS